MPSKEAQVMETHTGMDPIFQQLKTIDVSIKRGADLNSLLIPVRIEVDCNHVSCFLIGKA